MARNRITIGRSAASDVVIDESWDTVSNNHADIELRNGQLTFIDHSTNGTIINGQKIHNTSVGIYPGDVIMLAGRFALTWEMIGKYFPQSNRPTVTRNVRAEQQEASAGGRRTVNRQNPPYGESNDGAARDGNGRSRSTEPFTPNGSSASRNASGYGSTSRNGGGSGIRGTVGDEGLNDRFGMENSYSQAEIDKEIERWNWGAFFCTWLWAVCHKTYWPLIIIIVALIPYIGQVASLVMAVDLGLKGSKIAWRCGKYADFQSYKSAQKKWAIFGIVLFVLGICVQAFCVYHMLTII